MWLAVSSCLIFFTRASRLGPCGMSASCSVQRAFSAAMFSSKVWGTGTATLHATILRLGPDRGVKRKDKTICGSSVVIRAIEIISEWANVNGA